jgi:hypothetical protein
MILAHAIYAALEETGLASTEAGLKARRCAVMVPSLIDEAFVDFRNQDPFQALSRAEDCLTSLKSALSLSPLADQLSFQEQERLVFEIDCLRNEIEAFRIRLRLEIPAQA